jgi:hypothetical protein
VDRIIGKGNTTKTFGRRSTTIGKNRDAESETKTFKEFVRRECTLMLHAEYNYDEEQDLFE